jgi:pteridine reductase
MNNTQALAHKTALITGGARRIGAAISRCLHAAGMDVVIHYRQSRDEADVLVDELNAIRPDSAMCLRADLLDIDVLQLLIHEAKRFRNRLDVLINNAAVFYPTPLESLEERHWDESININLKAPLFLAKYAAEELRQRQGCIVNLTDIHADRPLREHPVYSTSKAGLDMLTMALAKELAPEVRVNGVSPGAILWPEGMDEATRRLILSRIMLGRSGEPEDIAKAVLYLVRDADYVTGQIITVDGGRTLYS